MIKSHFWDLWTQQAHHLRPIVSLVLLLVHPQPWRNLYMAWLYFSGLHSVYISVIISLYSISFVNNFPSSGELESTLFNLSISVCLLVNGESESWTSNFIAKRSNKIFLSKTRNFCKIFYYKAVARSLLALAIFIWIFDQRPSIPAHSIYPKPIPSLATYNLDLF